MPGAVWDDDDPADSARILSNIGGLLRRVDREAPARTVPTLRSVQSWHAAIYHGCRLPVPGYAGHFRGDPAIPELVEYEVGIGPLHTDGYPFRMGVWSSDVRSAVDGLLARTKSALHVLDQQLPIDHRPATPAELQAIANLAAEIHGEWVRIHPFANGNGRTARLWAAWLAKRYGLPIFVAVKPRPHNGDYATASHLSMGRPPDFTGDHQAARLLFASWLTQIV